MPWCCRRIVEIFGLFVVLAVFPHVKPSDAAEANGIWTESATKDLGEWTGIEGLKGIKIRGWLDTHFVHNVNQPARSAVNANQGSSIVKAHNLTIEGRTFDVHNDELDLSLAEIELEKVPTLGEWAGAGFKLDLNYGETPEIIYATINGALGEGIITPADKWIQHASVGWVAPVGRGLRIDAGKLVTHIGGETIETIKNNNHSRGFLYSYAIPFQDTGVRLNYPWSDTFYTEMYLLRGWNVTTGDNNRGITVGPSIGWLPTSWFNLFLNYLVGPEQRNDQKNLRHIVDAQVFLNTPVPRLNLLLYTDLGLEENAYSSNTKNAVWHGLAGVARYQLTDHLEPAVRLEYLHDQDGFATGVDQTLYGVTLTLNYKAALGHGFSLLVRPEYRFDKTSENFFTSRNTFRSDTTQHTVGVATYLYF
jgi:hypothetical protein